MLEEVVVSWQEVRWKERKRQNFIAQFIQLLKHWLCDMPLGIVMEKNWALSVDQCTLQALQVLLHRVNLLSILLRGNGFTKIQKAVVDQTGSRLPVTMTVFGYKIGFGKCCGASTRPNHWADGCQLSYKIHFSLHITVQSRNGLLFHRIRDSKTTFFFGQVRRQYLLSFFIFPICFKCQTTVG